jgi:hypothetical protein
MIKNSGKVKDFEEDFFKNQGKLSYAQSLKLFTAMWQELSPWEYFLRKIPWKALKRT